jgi:hypothetical protein
MRNADSRARMWPPCARFHAPGAERFLCIAGGTLLDPSEYRKGLLNAATAATLSNFSVLRWGHAGPFRAHFRYPAAAYRCSIWGLIAAAPPATVSRRPSGPKPRDGLPAAAIAACQDTLTQSAPSRACERSATISNISRSRGSHPAKDFSHTCFATPTMVSFVQRCETRLRSVARSRPPDHWGG